jgi:hypothetical protein
MAIAGFLKQSTTHTVWIGPFVDDTDGKTAETALTISQADVRLAKTGNAFAQKNDATACTHGENGYYDCPLNTTDTSTLGRLTLAVHEAGALPVRHDFVVLTAVMYDAFINGTDNFDVNVVQWLGTAAATPTVAGVPEVDVTHWIGTAAATPTVAGVPEVDVTHWIGTAVSTPTTAGVPEVDVILWEGVDASTTSANWEAADPVDSGTAQAGGANTITLRNGAPTGDLTGQIVQIISGPGVRETGRIVSYNITVPTAPVATIHRTWTVQPTSSSTYEVWPDADSASATDWTATEKQQLRYRLGIDGSESAPATNTDLNLGTVSADVVEWNGTAVPVEHTAGNPIVTVRPGTGTGEINLVGGEVPAIGIDGLPTAAENATAVWTRVLTEAGPTLGAAPTAEQQLVMNGAKVGAFKLSRSGTTLTAYASDETTVIATWTLDSATAPLSVDRTT